MYKGQVFSHFCQHLCPLVLAIFRALWLPATAWQSEQIGEAPLLHKGLTRSHPQLSHSYSAGCCSLALGTPSSQGDEECGSSIPGREPGECGLRGCQVPCVDEGSGCPMGTLRTETFQQMGFIGELERCLIAIMQTAVMASLGLGTRSCSSKGQLFFLPHLLSLFHSFQVGLFLLFPRAFIPTSHSLPF